MKSLATNNLPQPCSIASLTVLRSSNFSASLIAFVNTCSGRPKVEIYTLVAFPSPCFSSDWPDAFFAFLDH
jgi:hypothetical protein